MTVDLNSMRQSSQPNKPFERIEAGLATLITPNGEKLAYVAIFLIAVFTRFWDLGARVMSHDESLHTRFSWYLYHGDGFAHTPMMHGPILFHMTALNYLLFGPSDFTARIYAAVVGIIVVMLPFFMRKWLGKTGALVASAFFLISPLILYYSRYIREDMPAILGALIMVIAIWRYMERREFKYLLWLSFGQIYLFASKEVSFIYIAIFGSFMTLYLIGRLLEVEWKNKIAHLVFVIALIGVLFSLVLLGGVVYLESLFDAALPGAATDEAQTVTPLDPNALPEGQPVTAESSRNVPLLVMGGVIGLFALTMVISAVVGQGKNLRRFPELDVCMVMGTLILPSLTPFLVHFAGFNPLDETRVGIARTSAFAVPVLIVSVLIGLAYFAKPPTPRRVPAPQVTTLQELEVYDNSYDPATNTIEVQADVVDWLAALATSRWWAIAAIYYLIFIFFFSTMFTNGAGLATGMIGSLAYWLEQQGVERGAQPWYYYLMVMVPMYEFMPAILTAAAGSTGLGRWIVGSLSRQSERNETNEEDDGDAVAEVLTKPSRTWLDLDAPIEFPVLQFTGYWVIANLIAYSIAGEKMPWLTTHLTTPMILISGWMVGGLLDRIAWRKLWESQGWLLFLGIPVVIAALLRVTAPLCIRVPANLLCNTIIPTRYQTSIFAGAAVPEISATYGWLAALIVLVIVLVLLAKPAIRIGGKQFLRLLALLIVGWLTFLTGRTAWRAAYINYDYANEFLVYAHSSGAVKDVLDRIEEISLRTTDGYGLRVAYDDRVSWPMLWYFRDYYNSIYLHDQPSRGLLSDAPVILAGPTNWNKIEPLIGDRYYQFEYIRMWWPMEEYKGYDQPAKMLQMFGDVLRDPLLQRGLWEIFYNRNYDVYADAVARYRNGSRPNFELSHWPVAERMRLYIRKDVFAQVWDYGVGASEIAQAIDPYAAGFRDLQPDLVFGQGQLNQPHSIAMGPNGLLYVADTNNYRIAVFDQNGTLVQSFGTSGLAPREDVFKEPWGVAVASEGTIYVADTWNYRIVAYSPEGEPLLNWGQEGPNQLGNVYAFWGPRAVAVDDQGNVYVADTGNKRIMVYNAQGIFMRQIGSGGMLEGQLDEPVGLAFGPDGLLYVADTWNQRISVFTPEGTFVRQWYVDAWFTRTNERPYLYVDEHGNVYVTDPEAARVIVFDSFGQYLYSFGDLSTIGQAGAVVGDGQGHLFVVDTRNGAIQRYTVTSPGSPSQ